METIVTEAFKIEVVQHDKGHSIKLSIDKVWLNVPDHHAHEVIVEFGKYFCEQRDVDAFKKTKLFKSILSQCQSHANSI